MVVWHEDSVEINNFTGGLNTNDPIELLQDNELQAIVNYLINDRGEMTRRGGFDKLSGPSPDSATTSFLLGVFYESDGDPILIWRGTKGGTPSIYKSDGYPTADWSAGTGIGSWGTWWPFYFVQFAGFGYFSAMDGSIHKWDPSGTTTTSVATGKGAGKIFAYRDRIWNVDGWGSRIYYSNPAPNHDTWSASGFFDVGPGDGGVIVELVVYKDRIVIFKTNSVYNLFLTSDPTTWTLRQTNNPFGALPGFPCVVFENWIYFLSELGVFRTDGYTFHKISTKLDKSFRDRANVATYGAPSTWGANFGSFISVLEDRWLICDFFWGPDASGNATSKVFAMNLRNQAWTELEVVNSQGSTAILPRLKFVRVASTRTGTAYNRWLTGPAKDTQRYIYEYFPATHKDWHENSAAYKAIQHFFTTKNFWFGKRFRVKKNKRIIFVTNLRDMSNFKLRYFIDGVTSHNLEKTFPNAGTAPGQGFVESHMPGFGNFRTAVLKFMQVNTATVETVPLTISGICFLDHLEKTEGDAD